MSEPNFTDILRELRIAAGLNQSELSELLYMSRSTYNRYESGQRIPPVDFIIRVAALYKIHPLDLMHSLVPEDIQKAYPEYAEFLSTGKYDLTSNEVRLVNSYKSLNAENQEIVLNLIKKLSDSM